jgi:hypothetical protein
MEAVVGFLMAKVTISWRRRTRVSVAQTKVARLPKVKLQNVTDLARIWRQKQKIKGFVMDFKVVLGFCSM